MKFIFLGTSGWEQYPDIWCKCDACKTAMARGGKNIRTNSCAWISPDILIDFPPQIFMQAARFGININNARTLLVTHAHSDHFYPQWLLGRKVHVSGENKDNIYSTLCIEELSIYGNASVVKNINRLMQKQESKYAVKLTEVSPFEKYNAGKLSILALPANHSDEEAQGINYILKTDGKTILYALDSGRFCDEAFEEIRKHKFDLVVLDAGNGNRNTADGHCNFHVIEEIHSIFGECGILNDGSCFCISHLAPHITPPHDELEPVMVEKGITVAYDGLTINL